VPRSSFWCQNVVQETAGKGDMETMNPRMFIGCLYQLTPMSETLYSLPGGYFAVPGNCTRGSRSKKAPRVDLYVFGACRESVVYAHVLRISITSLPRTLQAIPEALEGLKPRFYLQERLRSPGAA
jgi:hypothetical protein